MKRVAVVVSSVLFFKNPVALLNWVGSGIAIFGTFLYSLAKDKAQAEAKASNAETAWSSMFDRQLSMQLMCTSIVRLARVVDVHAITLPQTQACEPKHVNQSTQ